MSKLSVKIHPLVIVTACDHHTRVVVGGSLLTKDSPTIGLLFGSVTPVPIDQDESGSCSLDIIDATDAVYTFNAEKDDLSLNMAQIKNKADLWVQVRPTQPLVGWYCIGSAVTPRHLDIHRQISSLLDDPSQAVMLLMNPEVDSQANQLPLLLFQLETVQQAQIFVEVSFKLEASPIESVVMDKVITSNPPEHVSAVEVQNDASLVSLRALLERVDLIADELRRMQAGEIPVTYELMRKAAKLCRLLPAGCVDAEPEVPHVQHEITDSLALSMLGSISANLNQLQALHGAYQQAYDRGGPGSSRLR
mmetsp:Transcript_7718/g.13023  ORF Transcript_7718/g.13023 Transcript_7718/m.13023 type:complete len:306 (-) Transcript_7718:329-1246(-)